jgi:hypothetical protein
MEFFLVNQHKKEQTSFNYAAKEKFLFYSYKILLDLWSEENMSFKELLNMEQKW